VDDPNRATVFSKGSKPRRNEGVGGGEKDACQVMVVGLHSGMSCLPERLAGQGMDQATFEAGGGEGPLAWIPTV
jgi:hypothetical protein